MAVARATAKISKIHVWEKPSDLRFLKEYIKSLDGSKILTLEETTTSQWLYTELRPLVDELIVCEPSRNRLLSEGPKNDKNDAEKLVKLLRADLLKKVYHSGDIFINYRKLTSAYESLIKILVMRKNRRSSLMHSLGLGKNQTQIEGVSESFVLEGLKKEIELLEKEQKRYESEFKNIISKNKNVFVLTSIPGVDYFLFLWSHFLVEISHGQKVMSCMFGRMP